MRIADALATIFPCFSFEFFAPKNDEGMIQLMDTIGRLRQLNPTFVSVTYGAGGSSRERTIELVTRFKSELDIEAMAHLTCVGASRAELREKLDRLVDAGIENVLALRGDPPRGETHFTPAPDGFAYATELTAFIRANYSFSLGGACYPEKHQEAPSLEVDLQHLVEKVNAGAEFLITQMFFDNAYYFRFVEQARAAGITVPIIPGLMPITNVDQIPRFAQLSGAKIPEPLTRELEKRADNPVAVMELGVAYATLQVEELLRGGAPGVHFYTLNRSPATSAILAAIQVAKPWTRSVPQQSPAEASRRRN